MNSQNNLEVKVEKLIQKPANEVFRALSEGRLFMNCGASSESMKIDFKVGGKYRIDFKQYELANIGEFLEIVPDKKIVFSWCSSFDLPLTPDTKVTIELFPDGNKTRLLLVHTGFKTESVRASHEGGWNGGLSDLTNEMQEGKLRMVRVFAAPVAKLYDTCKERMVKGEVTEAVPNKKLVFNLQSTQVTLNFDEEDDGGSSVEVIHDHLNTDALRKSHRSDWEIITEAMADTLGRN
jgi:uncharacterized protein YndB with AHSA1/START domain